MNNNENAGGQAGNQQQDRNQQADRQQNQQGSDQRERNPADPNGTHKTDTGIETDTGSEREDRLGDRAS